MVKYEGKRYKIIKQEMVGSLRGIRVDTKGMTYISVNSLLPKWKQQNTLHILIKNRKLNII